MQTYHVGLMALAVFSALGLLAFWSWRSKIRKQESSIPAPERLYTEVDGQFAFYVATTFAGRPLERVVAHGLAHRGKAEVAVSHEGVLIQRTGESSFRIPPGNFLAFNQSSAVIDRAVEKDGLVSIRWSLGKNELETHLRFVGTAARSKILSQLKDMVV
jgi:hypothetical protein